MPQTEKAVQQTIADVATESEITLCPEQLKAVETIEHTSMPVIILTGQAGSGKSTVINHLRRMRDRYTVCATTGKAAMHIGGATVDSIFCINRTEWKIWSNSYQERIMRDIPDRIIIDEASMIGLRMGNLIEEARSTFRKKIILVGDWAQVSPVKDAWIMGSDLLAQHTVIKLMENHRQDTDKPYMDLLNNLRLGICDDAGNALMRSRERRQPENADLVLYATNAKADTYNKYKFYQHINAKKIGYVNLVAEFKDERGFTARQKSPRDQRFIETAIDHSRLAYNEPMAIGARALITVNDPAGTFANGDTGTVVGFGSSIDGLDEKLATKPGECVKAYLQYISVQLDRTQGVVSIPLMLRQMKDPTGENIQYSTSGFPVALGFACTIHKAQGMTVNKAWVDMQAIMHFPNEADRHGLAYVALSRTRTLEGLTVSKWVPEAVYCDPFVQSLI